MPRPSTKPEAQKPARQRIVETAALLFLQRGYHATSIDDVLAASKTGKSQLYHYFTDKDALVAEVVRYRLGWLRERQLPWEDELDTWKGLEGWLRGWVALLERVGCVAACPVGQLGAEAGLDDSVVRDAVSAVYGVWRQKLTAGLTAMKARGELDAKADPAALADFAVCAVQGGTLVAKADRKIAPLTRAVEQTIATLRHHATDGRRTKR